MAASSTAPASLSFNAAVLTKALSDTVEIYKTILEYSKKNDNLKKIRLLFTNLLRLSGQMYCYSQSRLI